jgi:hypothetical protein
LVVLNYSWCQSHHPQIFPYLKVFYLLAFQKLPSKSLGTITVCWFMLVFGPCRFGKFLPNKLFASWGFSSNPISILVNLLGDRLPCFGELVATLWNLPPRLQDFFLPCWVVLAYGRTFTGFCKSWLTSSSSTFVQHECISTRAVLKKWKYYLACQFLIAIMSFLKLKDSRKNWWTY